VKLRGKCRPRWHVVTRQSESGETTYHDLVPIYCKSWDCPRCRRWKALRVASAARVLTGGDDVFMVTLTYTRELDNVSTWRNLGVSWNRLLSRVRRNCGRVTYIRVVEPHRSGGYPHLHCLIRGHAAAQDILRNAQVCGFGSVAHLQRVRDNGAGQYLCKYLTKDWPNGESQELRKRARARIVSVSRDIGAIFPRSAGAASCVPVASRESGVQSLLIRAQIAVLYRQSRACFRLKRYSARVEIGHSDTLPRQRDHRLGWVTLPGLSRKFFTRIRGPEMVVEP
jgi:hypothetical protein